MKNNVCDDEQIDDLLIDDRKILQQKNGYHFTSDSVRLAKFIELKNNDKICEFCAGCGIIGILLAIDGAKDITMIELQKNMAKLCEKNIKINNFENNIKVLNENIIDVHNNIGCEKFDIIVCNPPFEKPTPKTEKSVINIAKFEIEININNIVCEASKLLKFNGKLFLVFPAKRLFELNEALTKYNFKIKKCKFYFPKSEADTVYVCAVKGAKNGAKIEKF